MKILNIACSLAGILFVLTSVLLADEESDQHNHLGCLTEEEIDAGILDTDLFPHKVAPEKSEFWDIAYHGTYKILTNKASNLNYLLYQCGTEAPSSEEVGVPIANIISVPPTNGVVLAATPFIAYLELLGLRTDIRGFLGSESLISSPCLLDLIDTGSVSVAPDGTNATILDSVGLLDDTLLTLVNGWTGEIALNTTVILEEYQESSYVGTMEWIKVFGALFNMEEQANNIFDQAKCRFDAIADNVATVTSDMEEKPKVLWAYYSDYCQGWDVGECPNYYCDFAEACDVDILNSTEGSLGMATCGAPYMTLEEFVEFGKDADHWIYPSINWNSIYAEYETQLSAFKSVQAESVFDYQGGGDNAWFEQRFAEYDVVLNDFCLVAGTVASSPVNRRIWFRNVFTDPVGTLVQCDDPEAPYEPRGNAWSDCGSEANIGDDGPILAENEDQSATSSNNGQSTSLESSGEFQPQFSVLAILTSSLLAMQTYF